MTSGGKDHKGGSSGGRKGDDARAERLKAALRDNLRRRKAQARQRLTDGQGPAHDSAGFVPDKSKD